MTSWGSRVHFSYTSPGHVTDVLYGERLGLVAGHCILVIFCCLMWSVTIRSQWAHALSFWKTTRRPRLGSTVQWPIHWQYAVRFSKSLIPSHIITDPSRNLLNFLTLQACSESQSKSKTLHETIVNSPSFYALNTISVWPECVDLLTSGATRCRRVCRLTVCRQFLIVWWVTWTVYSVLRF